MGPIDFPNLRQLRMFAVVARLESLGKAATELNRSQPGITQTLAKLESTFGIELMDRRHSGSYLTEGGRILQRRTQRLFAHIEEALAEPLVDRPFADASKLRAILSKITSSHARCLIAMAEGGSIEHSARIVGISLSSLIRTMRELEQIIGRRLTRQTAHGVSPTQQASELARRFKLAATEIESAIEEIAAARGAAQTRISIGAMPQCATMVLVTAIDEFLRREPGARVKVEQKPYDPLLDDLRMGRIDFLFGVLRKPDWARDVDEEPLYSNPYAIMVRKGHPLTRKRTLGLDDFADYDWILPRPGTPRRIAFERLFAGAGRKPELSIETSAVDLQVTMIETSDRITMMPAQEIQRAASGGSVVTLKFPVPVPRGSDGIATRAGWQPTVGKVLFLQILRDRAHMAGARTRLPIDRKRQSSLPNSAEEAVARL